LPDPQTLGHPLARLSSQLFNSGYVLPVAERLVSDTEGWTATMLATALGIQGSNKVGGALARLEAAELVKSMASSPGKVFEIVDRSHPFWVFVRSMSSAP